MSEDLAKKEPDSIAWDETYIKVLKAELNLEKCPTSTFKRFQYQCQQSGLNPLLGQCTLVPRKSRQKDGSWKTNWTFITQKDGLLKRAQEFPDWGGKDSGYILPGDDFTCDLGTGEVHHKFGIDHFTGNETPIGAWARVNRKGMPPMVRVIRYDEFAQEGFMWQKMPGNMIEKCAVAAALREAYPDKFSSIYDEAELPEKYPELKVSKDNEVIAIKPVPKKDLTQEDLHEAEDIDDKIDYEMVRSKIRRLCHEMNKVDPEKNLDVCFQLIMENPKVKFDHIDKAKTTAQIAKLSKAIVIAEQWLKGAKLAGKG